jgi:hypothetical protein
VSVEDGMEVFSGGEPCGHANGPVCLDSGQPVLREHLAHVSPLLHADVTPSGTFHFDRATRLHPNG